MADQKEKTLLDVTLEKVDNIIQDQRKITDRNEQLSQEIKKLVARAAESEKTQGAELNLSARDRESLANTENHIKQFLERLNAELNLSEKDRQSLDNASSQIKRSNHIIYLLGGLLLFSGLIALGSMYFTREYYKTSVLSKEETRQAVLNDIKNSNQIIVDADIYQALNNEREMIMHWSEQNPNDSKSLETFRATILSTNPQVTLFEEIKATDIRVGN